MVTEIQIILKDTFLPDLASTVKIFVFMYYQPIYFTDPVSLELMLDKPRVHSTYLKGWELGSKPIEALHIYLDCNTL